MLIVLAGASGSGKSTLLPWLKAVRPDIRWHDFDERWVGGGKRERQQLTEGWIQTALHSPRPLGLLGPCPRGEVLAAPGAQHLSAVHHLLLDVADPERVRRLRARGDGHATQDMLNWAAWLRVHQVLADWEPQVLTDDAWEEMRWPQWQAAPQATWPGQTLDTTGLTPEQTAQRVQVWLHGPPGLAEAH
ncbi:hypothetical protein [Deinococcus multiflagellatus]|uniref:Uncharacterized protein n=1 Tax=Deinococcus multiflagellatus TaxID=1656887 RepID=A0ABW1ZJQ3_9DEIO|nr:hypothetical protein [Deinococcus multiflagellatus]MBZ9714594.1 hypothetical protein [Deinococcus multiflagellatus]